MYIRYNTFYAFFRDVIKFAGLYWKKVRKLSLDSTFISFWVNNLLDIRILKVCRNSLVKKVDNRVNGYQNIETEILWKFSKTTFQLKPYF